MTEVPHSRGIDDKDSNSLLSKATRIVVPSFCTVSISLFQPLFFQHVSLLFLMSTLCSFFFHVWVFFYQIPDLYINRPRHARQGFPYSRFGTGLSIFLHTCPLSRALYSEMVAPIDMKFGGNVETGNSHAWDKWYYVSLSLKAI